MWAISFMIIEILNDNLEYFINMSIANVGSFKNNLMIETKGSTIALMIVIPEIFMISVFYFIYRKNIKREKSESLNMFQIVLSYAIGSLVIIYPIFNTYHLTLSFILWLILLLYSIYNLLKELIDEEVIRKLVATVMVAIIIFTLIIKTRVMIEFDKNVNKDKSSFYYGMYLRDADKESIIKILDYLKAKQNENKNIKIISSVAMLYTLPLEIDNWYFDLPLTGNLGRDDYKTLTTALEKEPQGTLILIDNEKMQYTSGQLSEKTIEYVKNNAKKIDEIEYFDVYEKY